MDMAYTNTIDNNTVVCQSQTALSNSIDSETVLLSISKSSYYGMGPVASRIWQCLSHPILVRDLVKTLLQEYDTTEDQCLADVIDFLNHLRQEDLIDISRE